MTGEWYAGPGEFPGKSKPGQEGGHQADAAACTPRLFWDLPTAAPAPPDAWNGFSLPWLSKTVILRNRTPRNSTKFGIFS